MEAKNGVTYKIENNDCVQSYLIEISRVTVT